MEYVPADILVDILLRLSPIQRRRVRLVCRLWRDLVNERTPKTQIGPAKVLIDTWEDAYVVDDILGRGSDTRLWTEETTSRLRQLLVGSCNGLICLCNYSIHGGCISLTNPVTEEFLQLPPVPGAAQFRHPYPQCMLGWHDTYSFAYHSITGQYKIVHVPWYVDDQNQDQEPTTLVLKVFTLGEVTWKDVPIPPNARCLLAAGLVSLDGATYWVSADDEKTVMAFDLDGDRVTSVVSLPVPSSTPAVLCHLAEVRGSLAAVFSNGLIADEKIEIWVLEGKRGEEMRWSHEYNMQLPEPMYQEPPNRNRPGQRLTRPHLAHGRAILTHGTWYNPGLVRYEHTPSNGGTVQIHQWLRRRALGGYSRGRIHHTFAYTETTEPLIAYKLW